MHSKPRLRAGVCRAALLAGLMLAPAAAQAAPARPFDRGNGLLLKADNVTYESNTDVVTAEGHVEIDNKGKILLARRVVYDQKTGTVSALGNVSLLTQDGNVAFADRLVLTNEMRDGVLDGFKALVGKNGRLVASRAVKHGKIVTAHEAAYTPCKLCQPSDGAAPAWDVRAERVIYDQDQHRIYYHNATVELFGIPVLYTPIFSNADPTVTHKSGFLRPSGGTSSTLGGFVRLPYYIALSDSEDATLAPMITGSAGDVLLGEYRKRWQTGGMWVQPTVGYGKSGVDNTWHSSLFGSGRIPLDPTWRIGYDAELTSDQTYLKRYNISDEVTLDNDLYIEAIRGRSRFALLGYYFQDLREGRVSQSVIPLVLPVLEYSYIPRSGLAGGDFRMDLTSASVMRGAGAESERISARMSWRLPFVTPGGQLISFSAELLGDAWRVAGDPANPSLVTDLQGNSIPGGTRYITRGLPTIAADWRWPFIAPGASPGHAFVVEPIVQLIGAPYGGNPKGIPNEDSSDFELDDTNLFSLDRLPGHGLWESGPRANAGIQAQAFFPGGSVEMLLGAVERLKADPVFATGSGLSGKASDVVGRYRIRFLPYVSLTHRVDLDTTDGTVRRNEVYLDGNYGRSNLEISYVHLSQQAVTLTAPREEINAQITLGIGGNWAAFAAGRRDLQSNQMLDTEFGIGWENDCLGISVAYQRRYTHFVDVTPSTSVLFNVIPKLGGEGEGASRLFPQHVFAAPVQTAGVP